MKDRKAQNKRITNNFIENYLMKYHNRLTHYTMYSPQFECFGTRSVSNTIFESYSVKMLLEQLILSYDDSHFTIGITENANHAIKKIIKDMKPHIQAFSVDRESVKWIYIYYRNKHFVFLRAKQLF